MDIELYQEFVTLASHKNYLSAARDLNISQPTLSRHMAYLSKGLKCQLFYDTRPLTLTAAGEITLKYASKIISDEKNLQSALAKLKTTRSPRIRLLNLLHANVLYIGINEAMSQSRSQFNDLRFEYVNMDNSGMNAVQMVEAGKVDLSFDMSIRPAGDHEMPSYPDTVHPIYIPEFYGELLLGVSKNSIYADQKNLNLEDLKDACFIMEANMYSERFRTDFINLCQEKGFYPNISLVPTTDHLEFFSSDPGENIHLLSRVDRKYSPMLAGVIKQHTVLKPLAGDKYCVSAYALVRNRLESKEMDYFLDKLEEHSLNVLQELDAESNN